LEIERNAIDFTKPLFKNKNSAKYKLRPHFLRSVTKIYSSKSTVGSLYG